MDSVSFEDWRRWRVQGCTRLPAVLVERKATLPESWEPFNDGRISVLLESAQAGRYTYICDRPGRVIFGASDSAEIWSLDSAQLNTDYTAGPTVEAWKSARSVRRDGKPLEVLQACLAEAKTPQLRGSPPMCGGLIGVLGYDLVHTWERLPMSATRDLSLPLYAMIEPRELFVFDHLDQTLTVIVWHDVDPAGPALEEDFRNAQTTAIRARDRWREHCAIGVAVTRNHEPVESFAGVPPPSFEPEAFESAVRRVHEYIAAGHTYQVNLSLRTSRATERTPEAIYEALRRINPSPYMGLLRLPEFALVCGSPELLVRLVDGQVSSRPIAGTRPRGQVESQDSDLSVELLTNEKERAEHLMLVDLIRNDIGRVSEFGSVHVKEFMVLERYSHVMHIVSQVEGRLADGQSWTDVVRSMFPGGTITGCPKIRTMEIIEELEPVGRGFYTGALGWISYAGEMEMNIVIRSMLVQGGVAHVQSGAGIVADSRPERELDEALRKAEALWVALEEVPTRHHERR